MDRLSERNLTDTWLKIKFLIKKRPKNSAIIMSDEVERFKNA